MRFFTLIAVFVLGISLAGCASTPPVLTPAPTQVQGLAVIPKTAAAQEALGRKQPLIIQDESQQTKLFTVLEMNKSDASTSGATMASHDFVIRWKLHNESEMDRSQLYLRLASPKSFVYESDLGGSTKKYVIRMSKEDAQTIWNIAGVKPTTL
jgi:hypothetical protein